MSSTESDSEEYRRMLAQALRTDLVSVENEDIVRVWHGRDQEHLPVIVITPSHLKSTSFNLAYLLFVRDSENVCSVPYRIVLVNSNHGVGLRLAFTAARRARAVLPRRFRKNLAAVTVVHPDLFLRTAAYALSPFISSKLWSKVQFADRIQELELDGTFLPLDLDTLLPDSCRQFEEFLQSEADQHRNQAAALGYRMSR